MKTNTKIKLTKAQENMIEEVMLDGGLYKMRAGLGYCFGNSGVHSLHVATQGEVKDWAKKIDDCQCWECNYLNGKGSQEDVEDTQEELLLVEDEYGVEDFEETDEVIELDHEEVIEVEEEVPVEVEEVVEEVKEELVPLPVEEIVEIQEVEASVPVEEIPVPEVKEWDVREVTPASPTDVKKEGQKVQEVQGAKFIVTRVELQDFKVGDYIIANNDLNRVLGSGLSETGKSMWMEYVDSTGKVKKDTRLKATSKASRVE